MAHNLTMGRRARVVELKNTINEKNVCVCVCVHANGLKWPLSLTVAQSYIAAHKNKVRLHKSL